MKKTWTIDTYITTKEENSFILNIIMHIYFKKYDLVKRKNMYFWFPDFRFPSPPLPTNVSFSFSCV